MMHDSSIPKRMGTLVGALVLLGLQGAVVSARAEAAASVVMPLRVAETTDGTAPSQDATGSDPVQSRNAARSRMRECGHQWSSMKKNGSAAGATWKDFSRGCLAKQ